MANPEHVAILKQGVKAWNEWRKSGSGQAVDLTQADFSRAKLNGVILGRAELGEADFSEADLTSANLNDADLISTNLRRANLRGASLLRSAVDKADLEEANLQAAFLSGAFLLYSNLRSSNLRDAIISGADFSNSDLSHADLSGALAAHTNFSSADLTHTNFTNIFLTNTLLANVDLSSVQGIAHCRHHGPSTLDYRTLARSGVLPLPFLRGCGLPDVLIDYLPSILSSSIQFYSCFISYSTIDQAFADRLHADLQASGVRCWFAPHDIKGGRKLRDQIDEAIRLYDRLLLIMSEHSMESEWVKTETANARQREIQENRQMLFPISLVAYNQIKEWKAFDADTGKDLAREIREYFIPDFSNWKDHDSYQQAFQRLLRDLKAESPADERGRH
jgi:uncharacterized protein YjbI with pentapeptide repeats